MKVIAVVIRNPDAVVAAFGTRAHRGFMRGLSLAL